MNKIERRYKIISVVVIVTAVLCLVFGGTLYFTKAGYDETMFSMAQDCHKKYDTPDTCVNWVYDEWEGRNGLMGWLLGISVGLPVLFYGGGAGIDYLFPIKEKRKI